MAGPDLIAGWISSSGNIIGIQILGFLYVPWNQGGIVMQDSAGSLHLLTMGTDGRLLSATITI